MAQFAVLLFVRMLVGPRKSDCRVFNVLLFTARGCVRARQGRQGLRVCEVAGLLRRCSPCTMRRCGCCRLTSVFSFVFFPFTHADTIGITDAMLLERCKMTKLAVARLVEAIEREQIVNEKVYALVTENAGVCFLVSSRHPFPLCASLPSVWPSFGPIAAACLLVCPLGKAGKCVLRASCLLCSRSAASQTLS